ncbi:MAG: methylmalonyl-CoA mutase [Candidatus Bipolaricaulia bacterium]
MSGDPGERRAFKTDSDIEVEWLYTPDDVKDLDYDRDLSYPGQAPFTRGIYPTMYRGRPWTMRQYAGFGTARETNRRYRYLIEHGQMGLSVAFDLPTQMGYDSDDPMAEGEVGRAGVAIDTLRDMEILFDGIPLDAISTSMTINATAAILLAMYVALGETRGVPGDRLSGTIQNDILKEYIARGTYIYPPGPAMRLVADAIEYSVKNLPHWNPISISGYHMREAGATAVQELAFTMANGIAYIKAVLERGIPVDAVAPQLSFFFSCDRNFFEEAAKFRAARRLWTRILKERFGTNDPKSMQLRFHTQTAGSTLTAQQPLNNLVRTTLQALAAVLGGTQSLHTNAYDEALALPTERAVLLALRTQQIIAHESGVADTIDPLGGSYYVEHLTSELEQEAGDYLERIDAQGGALRAVETGYVQQEIHRSAYRKQIEMERGKRTVVGINRFVEDEGEGGEPEIHRLDAEGVDRQRDRLRRLRQRRDGDAVKRALDRVRRAAESEGGEGKGNLMPSILEAVKAYTTVGEISDALREVFGEFKAKSKGNSEGG